MGPLAVILAIINVFLLTAAAMIILSTVDSDGPSNGRQDVSDGMPHWVTPIDGLPPEGSVEPVPYMPPELPEEPAGSGGLSDLLAFVAFMLVSGVLVWAVWMVASDPSDGRVAQTKVFAMLLVFVVSVIVAIAAWAWSLTVTAPFGI